MTDASIPTPDGAQTTKKKLVFISVLAALIGGIAGFYATNSRMILDTLSWESSESPTDTKGGIPDVSYIEIDQITISINPISQGRHLIFRTQLEVPSGQEEYVRSSLPRIVDVMNGYLRALEVKDLESPAILPRIRAQLLRRIQIVIGSDNINDLLVMEFVIK